jgi:hypothetical protein
MHQPNPQQTICIVCSAGKYTPNYHLGTVHCTECTATHETRMVHAAGQGVTWIRDPGGGGGAYTQIDGVGWCTDAAGGEGTARYFRQHAGADAATDAAAVCDLDPDCVAYAFNFDGVMSSAFYSAGASCTSDCHQTAWSTDRSLIVGTSGGQWGSCFVKPVNTKALHDHQLDCVAGGGVCDGNTDLNIRDSGGVLFSFDSLGLPEIGAPTICDKIYRGQTCDITCRFGWYFAGTRSCSCDFGTGSCKLSGGSCQRCPQVRNTPRRPSSPTPAFHSSLLTGNAWANLHLLGQPNTFLAAAGRVRWRNEARQRWQ